MPRASTCATRLTLVVGIALVGGCGALIQRGAEVSSRSILQAAQPSTDAVTVEVYWANLPEGDAGAEDDLWRFVQEDRLDEGLRERLLRGGLRAGVVGGAPPEQVVRLLDPLGTGGKDSGADDEGEAAPLSAPTGVSRKVAQLRPGQPLEVKASERIAEATLLDARGRSGETIRDAQALYRVEVERRPDGTHAVVVTPELQHGEPRWAWSTDETGMISRQKPLRDKRVFADLRIEAPLVVGEMLLVTSRAGAESRIGGYLHRAEEGAPGARKAILLRLTQVPPAAALALDGEAAARR